MTDAIGEMISRVIVREGRDQYTNDPSDNGGPTKYGVTLATLHAWRKHSVSAEDVQQLGEREAIAIYREMFVPKWYAACKDVATLELMFDFGVNSGPGAVAVACQTVLKHIGYYDGEIDGAFGPKSEAAMVRVQNWPAFYYALKCERYELYMRFIGRDAKQQRFAIGWSNRQDQFEMKF